MTGHRLGQSLALAPPPGLTVREAVVLAAFLGVFVGLLGLAFLLIDRNPDGLRSECVTCGTSPTPSANSHHPSSLDHLPRVAEVTEGGTSRG